MRREQSGCWGAGRSAALTSVAFCEEFRIAKLAGAPGACWGMRQGKGS